MSEAGDVTRVSDERVEELLRVNAELAAEIRSLRAGRVAEPRSAAMPAARRLGRLSEELAELRADRDGLESQNQELAQHIDELAREYDELSTKFHAQIEELARLRGGAPGVVRRLRARARRQPPRDRA